MHAKIHYIVLNWRIELYDSWCYYCR